MKRLRILVVDDEYAIAQLLCQILEMEGHEVEAVHDGSQCLERLAAGRYDLILLDVMMPVMDGYATLQQLYEHYPQQKVVLMSAVSNVQWQDIRQKDVPFLPKPFTLVLLRRTVEAALQA